MILTEQNHPSERFVLDAVVGRRATLVCEERTSNNDHCAWRRQGQTSSPERANEYFGGRVLSLHPFQREDAGTYSCRCPPYSIKAVADTRITIIGVFAFTVMLMHIFIWYMHIELTLDVVSLT